MFPRMRASLVCVLALACAHPSNDAPAAGATAAASSMPTTREPASTTAPDSAPAAQHPSAPGPASGGAVAGAAGSTTQPAARGPMTAAEAAEAAARKPGASGAEAADDTAPCSTDADCVLTRHPPGSCCPSLCAPRAATKQAAAALEQGNAACKCAIPMCRPPPRESAAACVQNRCVVKDAGPTY